MAGVPGSVVQLSEFDDFITPSQACIKPIEVHRAEGKPAKIAIEPDGSYVQVAENGSRTKLQKANITLNDCLACSGCVTSAESVLIEMQNHKEVYKALASKAEMGTTVAVCISQQSYASIAAKHGMKAAEACGRLATALKSLGVDFVFDVSVARSLALLECQREFIARIRGQGGPLPVLTSACPGWICYAEKSHGDHVLPYISTVKSPQQVMGTLVKEHFAKAIGVDPTKVYLASVMPCYDKKLEASRDDFYNDLLRTRDVDCVIATSELEAILQENGIVLGSMEPSKLDSVVQPGVQEMPVGQPGSSSGGYLHHVYQYAAQELAGKQVDEVEVIRKRDFLEANLVTADGKTLKFAIANGFKCIQNIMRKIKRGKCPYDYIEIMACPKGCTNGGGQLRDSGAAGGGEEATASLAARTVDGQWEATETLYHELPTVRPREDTRVQELRKYWEPAAAVDAVPGTILTPALHTQYHTVEQTIIPQLEQW